VTTLIVRVFVTALVLTLASLRTVESGQQGATVRTAWEPLSPGIAPAGVASDPQALPVALRLDQLADIATSRVPLDLPLTPTLTVRADVSVIVADASQTHLAGPLAQGGEGDVSLTILGETLAGRIVVDGRIFMVRRSAVSPIHVVTEMDPGVLPPEGPPRTPPLGGLREAPTAVPGAVQDTNAFVDLMVLYTPAARAAIGGTSQMNADVVAAVNNANLALANANVTHRFRLAHYGEIAYTETGTSGTSLDHLTFSGDGQLETVPALRDQYRADVVTLLTNDTDACGVGWLMSQNSVTASFAGYAYNVVVWSCSNGNLTLAHEVGHNMGLHHDRANAGSQTPSFPYAFGYQAPGIARDVMAYACSGSNCPRRAIFSTPLFNFPGTGTPAGTATEDNARALDGTSTVVANFRQSVVCTYAVTPTTASYGAAGGTGLVSVATQAGCSWTVTSNQPAFLSVTSGGGSGNGTAGYFVALNGSAQRSGTLTVGGQTVVITQTSVSVPVTSTRTDFDGDSRADVAVFRGSTGQWYILSSRTGLSSQYSWGGGSDLPVPGDYDGDGRTDVAVFRPSTGIWYILQSATGTSVQYTWGGSFDVPVPGDYDGDGRTDIGVFRPSTGDWYILRLGTGTSVTYAWGGSIDVPVAGDYDGDGKTDVAVFRPSTGAWYVLRSASGTSATHWWGGSIDVPVPGDYDGDGRLDIAVFRPSTGAWYILRSASGTSAQYAWGGSIDTPVPADFDGDRRTDVAVFRRSTGAWYVLLSSTGTSVTHTWGGGNDIALPRTSQTP